MNPEEMKELKELIEFLKENNIGEFDLERGELKVRIKFAQEGAGDLASMSQLLAALRASQTAAPITLPAVQAASAPAATQSAAPAPADESEEASLHIVKSPIVGTFYESPSPGTSAFVKVGDQVEQGQVLCIIEAIKLMNEFEWDVAGEVVRIIATSGQPVEYGQPLFEIKPL